VQSKDKKLIDLTESLSGHAKDACLLMSLHWPHGWEMKDSELCFQNAAGDTVIRVYCYKNEGLTVGKKAAVTAEARQTLVDQFDFVEDPCGSVGLAFEKLELSAVRTLVEELTRNPTFRVSTAQQSTRPH
jgi:hypothetical protein